MINFRKIVIRNFLNNLGEYSLNCPKKMYTDNFTCRHVAAFVTNRSTLACLCYHVFFYRDLEIAMEFSHDHYIIRPISKAMINDLKFNKRNPKRYIWIDLSR